MNVGLIGFGGVGKAFIRLLVDKERYLRDKYTLIINIKYIIKSDGGIYNPEGINLRDLITFLENGKNIQDYEYWKNINIDSIVKNNDIDTLVELTSTNIVDGEPGLTHIRKALENNINVVTGNKGPILLKYKELNEIAKRNGLALKIGCTTGGALPSINGGLYDVAGSEINSIEGILNGTTNYILSEMMDNELSYEEALVNAQELGIAEADPTLDVEGFDSASKITILANVLMNADIKLEDLYIEGITKVNKEKLKELKQQSKKLKLIAKVERENKEIKVYVKPIAIDNNHPLYSVDYKNKGIYFNTDTLGDIALIGGASGTINAAASILRDIVLINR